MNRKRVKRMSMVAGLLAGAAADGCLRLTNGNDGNLLIHAFVFFVTAIVVAVSIYYIIQVSHVGIIRFLWHMQYRNMVSDQAVSLRSVPTKADAS